MIKGKIKNRKGISLISLAITVTVLIILSNVIIYNVRDNLKIGNLKEMKNDIENLRDKVSSYYAQYGKIPAKIPYHNIEHLRNANVISEVADTGDFFIIDLAVLDNLTLNRGKDFEKVKEKENLEGQEEQYTDLYIMNENSHNVFYVAGVTIDDETYYTDIEQIDTVPVDLRYIEGIKIPEGFYYVGGTKALGNIFIKNADGTENYKWMVVEEKITEIPNDVTINEEETEDFIKSVNHYQGYFKNTENSQVKYHQLDNWSPTYDKEGIYQDKNGDTAYIPKNFKVSETRGENTIDEGLVVKDQNENEWVWIEVPKSIYMNTDYNGGTAPSNSEDYSKIESIMQAYASDYRKSGYMDNFYSTEQHGFTDGTAYNNWKNSMLKSVYENGGFYIGRYEVGTDTPRYASGDTLTTPLIQRDKYPYNYVTCSQAQTLAKQLATGEKTSSLMFGIQWDLVMKFIEEKGAKIQSELKTDSYSWGNYSNATFNVKRKQGLYTTSPSTVASWNTISNYTKPSSGVLLTTGATDKNSALGIYDLAGNVYEWTLEKTTNTSTPCALRGGGYLSNSSSGPAFCHLNYNTSGANSIGFRSALW